ncbi:acetyltransferase [Oceanirhabdus sp. W0125-5]|uniref:acetyltransferase n=1 Tax=Oceanirhabdus sp. W0125-5 TaxID=2999116 RepID=UPI0022F30BD3|nr:acetyltransferase [Oceanirhabdus sp. W0125-5]WBW99436.1 acetyltransferase [Oceanirhabdus sp. W0125-5]
MEKIIIVGGGGHCKVIIDIIRLGKEYEIWGIIDNIGNQIMGVPVIGKDEDLKRIFLSGVTNAAIGIGGLNNPSLRWRIYKELKCIGFKLPVLIHPKACVSDYSKISEGTCIMAGAKINPAVQMGKINIINTGAIVEHDCCIGDNAHISPGAVVCGGCTIGGNAQVGANSVVIQGISIKENSIIGAGSVVTRDIEENSIAYGNPAKVTRKNFI